MKFPHIFLSLENGQPLPPLANRVFDTPGASYEYDGSAGSLKVRFNSQEVTKKIPQHTGMIGSEVRALLNQLQAETTSIIDSNEKMN